MSTTSRKTRKVTQHRCFWCGQMRRTMKRIHDKSGRIVNTCKSCDYFYDPPKVSK